MKKVEKLLKEAMDDAINGGLTAGVSLLAEKEGKELLYMERGMADREEKKPFRRDTILRLYSQTKPVTAAAAMILVERGKLDLWQPVSKYLPGFRDQAVWDKGARRISSRQVMVSDLLGMSSGLCYPDKGCEGGRQIAEIFEELDRRLGTDHPMTTLELANACGGCVLDFEPGTSFRYGVSADVMGAVIETVSDMPFSEFLQKELFTPLGMEDTGFWVPEEKRERLAKTYETIPGPDGNELRLYSGGHLGILNRMEKKPAFESGGAGLASTLDDYLKFARMLLKGGKSGGTRILQEETVRFMTGGELPLEADRAFHDAFHMTGFSYANFMRICKNPARAPFLSRKGEYGWDGWLGPYFANFPQEQATLLIAMQKKDAGTWELSRKLRNIVLSRL